MSTVEFDAEFEDDILKQCLRDESYLKRAVRICDMHHFGTRERSWVWKVVSETWNMYRERPTGRLILSRAVDEFPDEVKRKPYLALSVRLMKSKPTAPKSALEELSKFVRTVNLQLSLEESAKELERGNLEAAETVWSKSRSPAGSRVYTHVKWIEEFQERQTARKYEREHPDEFRVVPTGLKRLDTALAGGARVGELGLILATTGIGKSVMLSNICHASVKRKHPAVYFALEMPARQVAMRHDALWSSFRYNQFKTFDFKPSELREIDVRLKRAKKQFNNMFHIISLPVKSADVRTIRAALQDLKDEHGFTPTLIAMDSGDHLKAMDKSLDSYRLQQAEVYWELKRLAEEEGYVIWSSVHAGREWVSKIAMSEATSESYDKARIADLIVSLNDPNATPGRRKRTIISSDDDDDEPEEVKGFDTSPSGIRRLEAYLAKYRDGVSKTKFELDADFSRMLLSELDKEAEAEAA